MYALKKQGNSLSTFVSSMFQLKPENLMLSSEHSSDAVVKLVDFGCAEVIDPNSPYYDADEKITVTNTPGYSPPEMLDESKKYIPLSPAVDIFAVGVHPLYCVDRLSPIRFTGRFVRKGNEQQGQVSSGTSSS